MQQYIDILLKKINYPSNKYENFKESNVDKIVGNSNKTKYVFYITLEKLMNTIDYHEFVRLMRKSYSELQSIDVVFSLKNKCELDIREYYKYFIKILSDGSPLTYNLTNLSLNIVDIYNSDNFSIVINANSYAQELRLKSILNQLQLMYHKIGYDVNIDIKMSEKN